jgi:hypothetical protein
VAETLGFVDDYKSRVFLSYQILIRKKPYFELGSNIILISFGVGNVPPGYQRLLFVWGICRGEVLVHARLWRVECVGKCDLDEVRVDG